MQISRRKPRRPDSAAAMVGTPRIGRGAEARSSSARRIRLPAVSARTASAACGVS